MKKKLSRRTSGRVWRAEREQPPVGPPDVSGGKPTPRTSRRVWRSEPVKKIALVGLTDASRTCLGPPDVSRTSKRASDLQTCLGPPNVSRTSKRVSDLQTCLGPPNVSRTSKSVWLEEVSSRLRLEHGYVGEPSFWFPSLGGEGPEPQATKAKFPWRLSNVHLWTFIPEKSRLLSERAVGARVCGFCNTATLQVTLRSQSTSANSRPIRLAD